MKAQMDPPELLKIGDFARLAGTNLRTLRYYEEIGLLTPASRSEGGFRYYRPNDLNRVRLIQNLQGLGLVLDDIRELICCREYTEDRAAWIQKVDSALARQQELVETQLEQLEAQKAELASARSKLCDCGECPKKPTPDNNWCSPCERTGDDLPSSLSAL